MLWIVLYILICVSVELLCYFIVYSLITLCACFIYMEMSLFVRRQGETVKQHLILTYIL